MGRSFLEGRSYVRGRAPNLNRLSSVHLTFQSSSVFAQFSAACMFNWMLGQLRRVVGRSYVRERAPNLKRLSIEGKSIKSHPRPNSVFAQFSVVCMFNWMLGQLRKGCGKVVS